MHLRNIVRGRASRVFRKSPIKPAVKHLFRLSRSPHAVGPLSSFLSPCPYLCLCLVFLFPDGMLFAQTAPGRRNPSAAQPGSGIRTQGVDTRAGTNVVSPDRVQPNRVPDSTNFTGAPGTDGALPIRPGAVVNDRHLTRPGTTPATQTQENPQRLATSRGTSNLARPGGRGVLPEGGVPNPGTKTTPRAQPLETQPKKPDRMIPKTGAPFDLTPVQEADLNRFLDGWEQISAKYKRFESKFYCFTYGVSFTEGHSDRLTSSIPDYVTYGWIRFSAPNRGSYEVAGEIVDKTEVDFEKKAKREGEPVDGRRVKFLSTGAEVHSFDFAESKVSIYKIPRDQQQNIASGGPMPFVFGAKAADLKKRYYLRLVTPETGVGRDEVWLEAYPKTEDDAAEFRCVHLVVDRKRHIPKAFIKYHVNGSQRDVYEFEIASMKINSTLDRIFENTFFDPDKVPGHWTKVHVEMPTETAPPQTIPPQRELAQGNPQRRTPSPRPPRVPPSEEIELYSAPETNRPQF